MLTKLKVAFWLLSLLVFIVGIRHALDARDQAERRAADAEARLDTLRVVSQTRTLTIVGKLATYFDSTIRHLAPKALPVTATELAVVPRDTAYVHDTVVVSRGDSVLEVSDSGTGPPVSYAARVTLSRDSTDRWLARWGVTLHPSPIPLTVDVHCLPGQKPEVMVESPSWVTVSALKTNAGEQVCGKPPNGGGSAWRTVAVILAGLATGLWITH